jgi:hypothetical protein
MVLLWYGCLSSDRGNSLDFRINFEKVNIATP